MSGTTKQGWTGYMDGYLKENMDKAKKIIKKDWDMVFIVDGYEGSGKSVLAQQVAKHVDPSFNIDRICFSPEEFVKAINSADRYQAVIYDEAYEGLSSRSAMSQVNRSLVAVLAEIRQKNLFVFIVLPCFFELDKYAAVWRSRALIHVYIGDNFERGKFGFYNQERKKQLYVLGKKFYSYYKPPCNFFGSFTKGYTVDEDAYRKKKVDALKVREQSKEKSHKDKALIEERDICIRLYVNSQPERSQPLAKQRVSEDIGKDVRTIQRICANTLGNDLSDRHSDVNNLNL
jgi:hypothetical protein